SGDAFGKVDELVEPCGALRVVGGRHLREVRPCGRQKSFALQNAIRLGFSKTPDSSEFRLAEVPHLEPGDLAEIALRRRPGTLQLNYIPINDNGTDMTSDANRFEEERLGLRLTSGCCCIGRRQITHNEVLMREEQFPPRSLNI